MIFSATDFLFAFLPITLIVYFITPFRFRNLALFLVSLVFYGWEKPVFIPVMLASILIAYVFGFFIEKYKETDKKKARLFMIVSISLNLAVLCFFKYTNFFIDNLSALPFISLKPISWLSPMPMGISFYTFQIVSYSVDCYRGEARLQKNFIAFGTYVVLFPQLVAGPIVRYKDIDEALRSRKETFAEFAAGAGRFCAGLSKKLLLSDTAAAVMKNFRTENEFSPTALGAWIVVIAYTFHIYFDFSGYSDMAIGLGRMFGFKFPENFNYPYISRSITEFWRRWHISLSAWFRDYLYIPLGGNRKGALKQYRNIAVVWFLTGFWHGAAWNFIIWGAYFGIILMLEKIFVLKRLEKAPKAVGHIYSLILIMFGWLIFSSKSAAEIFDYLKMMAGYRTPLTSEISSYGALRIIPLFAVCVIASTPLVKRLYDKITAKPVFAYINPALIGSSMLLCAAYAVDSSFSTFLYKIF